MINFLLGMLLMYFIINLYFATICFNNSPTQFRDIRKNIWFGFVVDLFIGIWLRGIMYKIETLVKWNTIMMKAMKGKCDEK